MYCYNCGQKVDGAKFCPYCGVSLENNDPYTQNQQYTSQNTYTNDRRSLLWCVLSFVFPFVGIIAYFLFKREKPNKAQGCLNFALVSMLINFVMIFIF